MLGSPEDEQVSLSAAPAQHVIVAKRARCDMTGELLKLKLIHI